MVPVSLRATLAAALAAAAAAPSAPAEDTAPPPPAASEPPAAVVRGRPLPRRAVHEELARRFLRGEHGDRLLEQLLMDTVARREQERRGVAVPDEEVRAALEDARTRTAEQMAKRGERVGERDPLESFLGDSGFTLAEFVDHTRRYLALQKMAREDLGAQGEVPNAQIEVWLRDLLRRRGATADPAKLGPGEAARLGEEPVTWEQAGRWLSRTVRRTDLVGVAYDLAFALSVEDRAAKEGVSLSAGEIEAEVERLRGEFQRQPGIEGSGVSFEDWLRDRQGLTADGLRRDASFRARLLAKKMAAAGIPAERVRKEWEEHPDLWGETARVRRIVVFGEERASVFGAAARPMAEARRIADRALEEIASGKPFETVARKYSEEHPPDGPRGRPLEITPRATAVPQPVVDAVFRAKEGEVLGPLRAVDGWHLVRVERRTPAPSFEECAPRVRDEIVARTVRDWKVALRSDPEVRIAEDL